MELPSFQSGIGVSVGSALPLLKLLVDNEGDKTVGMVCSNHYIRGAFWDVEWGVWSPDC